MDEHAMPVSSSEYILSVNPNSGRSRERIQKAVDFSEQVQQEDIGLCESVQRGLQSSLYDRGRYSVKRENGVHHFHMLLSEFLG